MQLQRILLLLLFVLLGTTLQAKQQGMVPKGYTQLISKEHYGKAERYVVVVTQKLLTGVDTLNLSDATQQVVRVALWKGKKGSEKEIRVYADTAYNMCDNGSGLVGKPVWQDADKNEKPEALVMIQSAGNCDVSPQYFVLVVMSEQLTTVPALVGNNVVQVSNDQIEGGDCTPIEEFETMPEAIQISAHTLWKQEVGKRSIKYGK